MQPSASVRMDVKCPTLVSASASKSSADTGFPSRFTMPPSLSGRSRSGAPWTELLTGPVQLKVNQVSGRPRRTSCSPSPNWSPTLSSTQTGVISAAEDGVLLFDDTGQLLPNGRVVEPAPGGAQVASA
ncbi:DUF5999 family protein [Streptomyces lydicus]|uniref:DUF5999 family protein n=1 Tax=Streptomyces lydicus TaxID=47763 RepID=UPI00343296BC